MPNPTIKIYIVNMVMSSPNHIDNTEELSDTSQRIDYTFNKGTRQRICAVRTKFRRPVYESTLNFHSLHICQNNQINEIRDQMYQADKDMKEINPSLYSYAHFIPLDMASIEQGKMYDQIISTIRLQIYDEIIKRIDDTMIQKGTLPDRTKKALLNMVDRMRQINVLNDTQIEKHLDEIRQKIIDEDIKTIKEELTPALGALKLGRAAFLEF